MIQKCINKLWYFLLYGKFMVMVHRLNWHHMEKCYPDGDTLLICHWCGIRIIKERFKKQGNCVWLIGSRDEPYGGFQRMVSVAPARKKRKRND